MTLLRSRGWRTVYRLDWTAQGSQNIKTNQDYVVDGRTWTTENGANSNTFDITNGTGLVFTSISGNTANYGDNTRTATLFRVNLRDVVPDFRFSKRLRILCRVILANADTNFEFVKMGLEDGESAAVATLAHMLAGRGFSGSLGNQNQITSFSTASNREGLLATNHDVLALIYRPPFLADFYSGQFGGDFPSGLTFRSSWGAGRCSVTGTTGNAIVDSQLRFVLVCQATGGTGSFTATFTHLRFDVMD